MKLSKEVLYERKKEILLTAAAIALARSARKSSKYEDGELKFNVQIVGEKTKTIIADQFDKSMKTISRLAGNVLVGSTGKVRDVEPEDVPQLGDDELTVWDSAVNDPEGWSGQLEDDTLQNG